MILRDYSRQEIEAAIKMKGLNQVSLAKQLNRSASAVSRVIKGVHTIESKRLDHDVLEALKPEIETIHKAFSNKK